MKKQSVVLFIAMLIVPTLGFGISLNSMTKDEVMKSLEDKTITTVPFTILDKHLEPNNIIVYFGTQGQLSGAFAHKPPKDVQNDQGTWNVKDDGLICATWQHWDNANENCVYAFDTKNGVLFIGADGYLNTVVLKTEIKPGNQVSNNSAPAKPK